MRGGVIELPPESMAVWKASGKAESPDSLVYGIRKV